jgi:hypothetical protein
MHIDPNRQFSDRLSFLGLAPTTSAPAPGLFSQHSDKYYSSCKSSQLPVRGWRLLLHHFMVVIK